MTPAMAWLKRFWEKTLGRWEEGPEPPQRLVEMALAFANSHPTATRAEWLRFSVDFASVWYKSGYQRGFEYVERIPQSFLPKLPPELMADQMDPSWRWRPADLTVDRLEPIEVDEEDPNPLGYNLDEAYARLHAQEEEPHDE